MSPDPPTRRYAVAGYRLFFGLLTLLAIGRQLTIHVQEGFSVVNFFSYFTNVSNMFATVVLIIGACAVINRRTPTMAFEIVRGNSAACMAVVGIVFSVVLRDEDLGSLLPWINAVLHYIMPVVLIADWLFQPPGEELSFRQVAYWIVFPGSYLAYSIIRGTVTGFYAYPFFDPAKAGGYLGIALYCVAILFLFLVVSLLLIISGRRKSEGNAVHT